MPKSDVKKNTIVLEKNDLILKLLELKLHDFMLAYGSMRVALEEILESSEDLRTEAFERLGDTVIAMLAIPDEKLFELIESAETNDEAHEAIDIFIDDMTAPGMILFERYLGEEGAALIKDQIMEVSHVDLHDRVDRMMSSENEDDKETVDRSSAN